LILDNCRNATSPIWTVDAVYTTANLMVCQAACPCYANSSLWNETTANEGASAVAIAKTTTTTVATATMFNNDALSHKYQDCDLTQAALDSANYLL